MIKYEVVIYWDEKDHIYVAEMPELPGCMVHGESYFEAVKNIQEACSLSIDTAKEFGREIPEPKGRTQVA